MADGWRSGRTIDEELPPRRYEGGDEFGLTQKFPTPDHSDNWPMPNIGDDLNKNSGRYKAPLYGLEGYPMQQNVSDLFMLQGRQQRLALVESIETEQREKAIAEYNLHRARLKARKAIVEAAFDAALESTYNEGQYKKFEQYRSEFIARYATREDRTEIRRSEFMGYWASKLAFNDGD